VNSGSTGQKKIETTKAGTKPTKKEKKHKKKVDGGQPPLGKPLTIAERAVNEIVNSDEMDAERLASLASDGGAVKLLQGIQSKMGGLDQAHRAQLALQLAKVFAIARILAEDKDAFVDVCNDGAWEDNPKLRPKPDRQGTALKVSLRLAIGFEPSATKKVSKYHAALAPLFSRGVKPANVPKAIEEGGGIEAMAGASAAARRGASAVTTDTDSYLYLKMPLGVLATELQELPDKSKGRLKFIVLENTPGVMTIKPRSYKRDIKAASKAPRS